MEKVRERLILYDFTYMWDLKITTNKHNEIVIDTEIKIQDPFLTRKVRRGDKRNR